MSVPIASLKRKKQYEFVCDELALEKLMRYYGFEKKEELLEFLNTQGILDL
jgi:hypothetical protein